MITAEVESEALGPLLAQLARMGLQNIGYELVTDVVTFRKNKAAHDTSATDEARAWFADRPAFAVSDLIGHFKATGRTPGSAAAAVQRLTTSGELIRMEKGHYRRVDKAPAPPPGEGKQHTRVDGPRVVKDIPNYDFIVGALKHRKRITSAELTKLFVDDGRNPKSISPILFRLRLEKVLKATATQGEFEVLKTAGATKAKIATTAAAKEKDRLRAKAKRARAKAAKLNGGDHAREA